MAKTPAVSAQQLQQALYRKIADLDRQDKAALAQQIELERSGAQPIERPEPQPEIERAKELLNGFSGHLSGPAEQPGVALWEVLHLRKAIRLAQEVLQREEVRLGSLGLAEWLGNGGLDRWRASRRRLADAIATVTAEVEEGRAIHREAMAAAGGQFISLPGDRGDRPILSPHATAVAAAIKTEVMT